MPTEPVRRPFVRSLGGSTYLASGRGDLLNGAHEDVGDDCHPHEAVEQAQKIKEGSHFYRPRVLIDER